MCFASNSKHSVGYKIDFRGTETSRSSQNVISSAKDPYGSLLVLTINIEATGLVEACIGI